MRFLHIFLSLVGVFVVLFWGGTVLAVTVAKQQPPQSVLAGFNVDCVGRSRPCWHGIVPGETTVAYASNTLQWQQKDSETGVSESLYSFQSPSTPEICRVFVDSINGVIAWMTLKYCESTPLHIGDVIAVLGMPARILGANREIGYGGVYTNDYGWWSPFDQTRSVALVPVQADTKPVRWHGFIPKWRYCQLEADTPGCSSG